MPDTNQPIPKLIPASLLRVRRFLNAEGAMKVKPWATVEETLDAFHDSLAANCHNDTFWNGLESLLAILSADIKQRTTTRPDELIDNELLVRERQQQLLHEIRRALANQKRGRGGFRGLISTLSPPAMGLLVMLGGVASQGCYSAETTRDDRDAAQSPVGDSGAADAFWGDTGTGTAGTQAKDNSILPQDSSVDAVTIKPETGAGAPDACIRKDVTIVELINNCISDKNERTQVLACIDALDASWRTGIEELFQCQDCDTISNKLFNFMYGCDYCADPRDAGDFDRNAFFDNCLMTLYLGVRFE
jgi:hypothetical protein